MKRHEIPPIPFFSLEATNADLEPELQTAFARFVARQWYILGEGLAAFEQAYAHFSGTRFCVGVGNGFDALYLALRALQIGPGDEVVVPAHTFSATALSVSHTGARPVFAEPDAQTGNVTAATLEPCLSPRTRAVVPVHLYGQPCAMDAILALAARRGLQVVEDNAQAHGATFQGKTTGSFGLVNATSFYPTKNLGALGDGGGITTDDPALADQLRQLRNYGSAEKYHHAEAGVNSRLDEWQADVLRLKLAHVSRWTDQRRILAARYHTALAGVGDLQRPVVAEGASPVWYLYVVRTARRDALQRYLADRQIGTLLHYPVPVPLQPVYAREGYRPGDFPEAERWSATCLSLPLYPGLTEAAQTRVIDAIRAFFAKKESDV
ncbi:DegT/DnrJ/EryC1/StrS family aminotransferase [Catalinimonas alkaloidigena]|uniref:DegT/DnrJ/EryC1/StrS family aminotransferase n=1 Tax=Catalinimonas alkaloidigena TaxID=1075417 RepID=UPI001FE0E5E0|nr:DegT/DnrJ/EryC1/StrS family aminotransferase [Catalinimonas alkaloidigena]